MRRVILVLVFCAVLPWMWKIAQVNASPQKQAPLAVQHEVVAGPGPVCRLRDLRTLPRGSCEEIRIEPSL